MQRSSCGVTAVFLIIVLIGFGFVIWNNAQPTPELRVILPTQAQPTAEVNAWESVLRAGFGSDSTPLPTVAIPTGAFVPPTLALAPLGGLTPVAPADVGAGAVSADTAFSIAVTPTPPQPSVTPLATFIPVTAQFVTRPPTDWRPPPLIPPISRDPLGRDHYWLLRPVDSNANNAGLFYYPYGSDGAENQWRIHAGIDMPNPIGQTVRAAGSGVIEWAADSLTADSTTFQNTFSYGNTVVIRHDFGYRGQPIWTLYAHLSAVLVRAGQTVQAGDAIGLVGNTGRVTGPHVHFEVRLRENRYADTVNPVLWMVPYVGTGVIAGRVTDVNGDLLMDVDVTIRNWATGLVEDTTTTYIYQGTGVDVNADPSWDENFAVADLPVGRYTVTANIGGELISQRVNVIEGTTTFVEISPSLLATTEASGGT